MTKGLPVKSRQKWLRVYIADPGNLEKQDGKCLRPNGSGRKEDERGGKTTGTPTDKKKFILD